MRRRYQERICGLATRAVALAILMCSFSALLQAEPADPILEQSYRSMYDLQFDAALKKAEEAKQAGKDDPLPWIAQACAVLFREFDRLNILSSEMFTSDEKWGARKAQSWNGVAKKEFEAALAGAEKLAQARLEGDKNNIRGLFAMTMVQGLRADDAALIERKNLAALGFTRSANGYAERLLARAPDYYDAYVATGMGKYLIGGRAAPIRWVLRLGGLKGDQEEGLKEMRLAAERGHNLAPFARIMLAFDDLRHKNKAEARKKLTWLSAQFPHNPHFHEEMAKLDGLSAGSEQ